MKHLIWLIKNEKPERFVAVLLMFLPFCIILNALIMFKMITLGVSRASIMQLVENTFCTDGSSQEEVEEKIHVYRFWTLFP